MKYKILIIPTIMVFLVSLALGDANITGNVSVTDEYQINGIDINTGGTLPNVCYLDQENIFTQTQKFTNINLSGSIYQDTYEITNMSSNSEITGDIFAVIMTGPTSTYIPHFWIQPGGPNQASGIARSFIIVNEDASILNSTNRTDCSVWQDSFGIPTEDQIDCNTTTTGADLLVGDDFLAAGDVKLRDSENETHSFNRELQEIDNFFQEVMLTDTVSSQSGTTYYLNSSNSDDILVNIDGVNYDLSNSESVTITEGTNIAPIMNFVTIRNNTNIDLVRDASDPGQSNLEHIDVAKMLVGSSGNNYLYLNAPQTNLEFVDNVYRRMSNNADKYVSGFSISGNANGLNFTSGSYWTTLNLFNSTNTLSMENDGFFWVRSNGTFVPCTDFSCFDEFSNGVAFGGTRYVNLIIGLLPNSTSTSRIVVIPQNEPNDPYSLSEALEDQDNTISYSSNNANINNEILILARVILDDDTDSIEETFPGNSYFKSLVNLPLAGAAGGGTNDHSLLTNLDYASSGHTGFMADNGDTASGSYNFTGSIEAATITRSGTDVAIIGDCPAGEFPQNLTVAGLECAAVSGSQLTEEQVEDFAWSTVLTGNESGISVTYQDSTNDVDFIVDFSSVDECLEITNCVPNAFDALSDFVGTQTDEYLCSYESSTSNLQCDLDSSVFSQLGSSIDDTEMTAEDFGEFTCTGLEDGCTINNDALDDQYYDSESDLTALLDDNYEDELNNEAGLYSALSDVTEFIETNDDAALNSLIITENLNMTNNNITDISYTCYSSGSNSCDAKIHHNGTGLVIEG